jgi:II/X family phage/plasmid replication protein
MIDWVDCLLPFTHTKPIAGGGFVYLDQKGDVSFERLQFKEIRGSHETGLMVVTYTGAENLDGSYPFLKVSGNPTKLFQGHNLWGTNDLHGLVCELYHFLCNALEVPSTTTDYRLVKQGVVRLLRVDINESFLLDTLGDCKAWIRAAENSTRMKHRGRGEMKGTTLYFGKNSEHWATKIYSKGQEIREHGVFKKQPAVFGLPQPQQWADRALRIEHVLRSKWLKHRKLDLVANWADNMVEDIYSELLQKLEFAEAMTMTPALIEELPGSLQGAYALWKQGADLRQVYSRPTFYRYRSKLLEQGIDISIQQKGQPDNIVPLVRILEAVPAGVPDWAIGTALYFEPRKFA